MSVRVMRASGADYVDRNAGVRTRYLISASEPGTTLLSGITEFDPGTGLPMHTHNCVESVVVLEGQGVFETPSEVHELTDGDVTFVPADVAHRFVNSGESRLRILWTYGSADATRTLIETGETFSVGSARDHRL
jgi:putative monooxygenase